LTVERDFYPVRSGSSPARAGSDDRSGCRGDADAYLPTAHGFLYLVAILDIASRKALAFRVSNTMTADFCVEAQQEALAQFGPPEIFNTDQGSQFTSEDFTTPLKQAGVAISMDRKGRWIDNVFIERLWRSVKYEVVYLHAYSNGVKARERLIRFNNPRRSHQTVGNLRPDDVYLARGFARTKAAA